MKAISDWYIIKKSKIQTVIIVLLIIIIILISLIPIYYYLDNFGHQRSSNSNDWSNFGEFYNGIVSPFLSFINIIVLLVLTIAATNFNKKSLEKQLIHSTCKEYQNKINDLTFNFFENLELFKENSEKKYFDRAIERLLRIKFFVNAFLVETEPLILNMNLLLEQSQKELNSSIDELITSNFSTKEKIQNFLDKKSEFIKTVFNIVNK